MTVRPLGVVFWGALVILALGSACRGPESGSETTDSREIETRPVDTAAVDATQTDSSMRDTTGSGGPTPSDAPPPPPAPGTVRILGTIDTCEGPGEPLLCRIGVQRVIAYGPATPTLNTEKRSVGVAPGLVRGRPTDSLATHDERILILKHAGPRPPIPEDRTEERSPVWTIHEVHEP